jgi:polyvinyl alcohol dehydrogenase (cytochrome)
MIASTRPVATAALLLAIVACGGEDGPAPFPSGAWWPSYGKDLDNSRANADESELTPDTVGALVPVWQYAGPGVTSTPVVVDGHVFVGTWRGRLVVLDAATGRVVREIALPGAGTVDATPCVTADRIYIGDGAGTLHAIDRATGAVQWSTPLDPQTPTAHLYGSPVYLADVGLVVSGVASIELTLDGVTDYQFRGSVVAVDAATGAERWRRYLTANDATAGAGVSVWSTAAVDPARRLLFIGTGQSYEAPASLLGDALVAIRYDTGELAWHRQFTADDVFTFFGGIEGPDFDVGAAPNLFTIDGRDVVGVADKAGVYSTLDRDTGEIVWARQLTVGSHLGGVMVTAAVHDGSIYVVSNRWATYDDFGDPRNTSIAFGLDTATGVPRWQLPLAAPSFGAVSWAGGVVYVGTIDGTLHALAASDGRSLWRDPSLQPIGGGATIAAGRLLVPHGFVFLGAPGEAEGGVTAYGVP